MVSGLKDEMRSKYSNMKSNSSIFEVGTMQIQSYPLNLVAFRAKTMMNLVFGILRLSSPHIYCGLYGIIYIFPLAEHFDASDEVMLFEATP